jgi:hypothetical protein
MTSACCNCLLRLLVATGSSLAAPHGARLGPPPANTADRNERYLIVTSMVMTDVPEAFGPVPLAVMAKLSLPLYLAFAVYS